MFESLDSVLLPEHLDHFGFYVPSQPNHHQSNHPSVSNDEYWMDSTDSSDGQGQGLASGQGQGREASVWVYGHEVAEELAALKVRWWC